MQRLPITSEQIKKIHMLKSALAMDGDTYRAMLDNFFGVRSSKLLDTNQAARLTCHLESKATVAGVWGKSAWSGAAKTSKAQGAVWGSAYGFGERDGMATAPQLRMIETMWGEVSRAIPECRAKALRQFVNRIAHVSDLRFLDSAAAGKVINVLKKMQGQVSQPVRHCGVGQH